MRQSDTKSGKPADRQADWQTERYTDGVIDMTDRETSRKTVRWYWYYAIKVLYTLKFSQWINFCIFSELVCIREIKTAKIIGNWSENEARYVFAEIKNSKIHRASFVMFSWNKHPHKIFNQPALSLFCEIKSLQKCQHIQQPKFIPTAYHHHWQRWTGLNPQQQNRQPLVAVFLPSPWRTHQVLRYHQEGRYTLFPLLMGPQFQQRRALQRTMAPHQLVYLEGQQLLSEMYTIVKVRCGKVISICMQYSWCYILGDFITR